MPDDCLWRGNGNYGDNIQTIAVKNLLQTAGLVDSPEDEIVPISREDITTYDGEEVVLPMQGWFGAVFNCFSWPPASAINPVFIGFHWSPWGNLDSITQNGGLAYLKEHEPIGCRDLHTQIFMESNGVKAYFSGCCTLTLPKRDATPSSGLVYVVDVPGRYHDLIPGELQKDAVYSVSHKFYFADIPVKDEEARTREAEAVRLLCMYRNSAKLVITSRIHCAMPCLAMGIPVVFVTENPNDARYSLLRHFVPIYDINNPEQIDWNPAPVEFESLKQALILNAAERIRAARIGEKVSEERSRLLINNVAAEYAKIKDLTDKKIEEFKRILEERNQGEAIEPSEDVPNSDDKLLCLRHTNVLYRLRFVIYWRYRYNQLMSHITWEKKRKKYAMKKHYYRALVRECRKLKRIGLEMLEPNSLR